MKNAAVDIVKLTVDRNGHQTIHFSDKYQVVSIEPASSRTILIKVKNKKE